MDYYLESQEVLRGEVVGETVIVRILGDYISDTEEYANFERIELEVGQEYLLILKQLDMGSDYQTEGSYYYVQNESNGAYQKEKESDVLYKRIVINISSMDVNFQEVVTSEADTIDYPSYKELVKKINKSTPVDPSHHKKELLSNLKANIESGFVT